MKTTIVAFLLFTTAVLAQPAQYARVYYTKWKPGMAAEGQAFIKDVAQKAALNWVKTDPSAVGQITMSRLLPGGSEFGHDRLRLTIATKPPDPDFIRESSPGSPKNVEAVGMNPAAYQTKLRSFMETVRTEVWSSEFRQGAIREGDYVRVTWWKVPAEKRTLRAAHNQTWLHPMLIESVKAGITRGMESWTVRFGAEDEPYAVRVTAWPDSASVYKNLGMNELEAFNKAHPGKDYHTYRQAGDALASETTSVRAVLYRVDSVAWK